MTVKFSRSIIHSPAVTALIIQCLSFACMILIVSTLEVFANYAAPLVVAALLQGLIAAGLSRLRHMASWWLLIHLLFPVSILLVQSFHLPHSFFLVAFLSLLGLYWSTFRTQVPFFPSGLSTWDAVAGLLPPDRSIKFIDIGSGLGGLILYLSGQRKESAFFGIELAPLPWLISVIRAFYSTGKCCFLHGDYCRLQFSEYDVVFAFLSPAVMESLWQKAQAEMRPGTLLLSYEFLILDRNPDFILPADKRGAELYGWTM